MSRDEISTIVSSDPEVQAWFPAYVRCPPGVEIGALKRLWFEIVIEQPSDLAGAYPVTVEMEPKFTVGKRS